MAGKKSTLRTIVNRNVERHLVKEFLMQNTKRSGFGALDIRRTPQGTEVTVHAERPGMVIGRKGKIINELQKRLNEEFDLENPKLKVEEIEKYPFWRGKVLECFSRGLFRGGHSEGHTQRERGLSLLDLTFLGRWKYLRMTHLEGRVQS